MSAPTYIYALRDPRTGRVFYVGKSDEPYLRFRYHVMRPRNTRKAAILQSIPKRLLKQTLIVLESVPTAEWKIAEKWWIAQCRKQGEPLTNIASGGGGGEAWMTARYLPLPDPTERLVFWGRHFAEALAAEGLTYSRLARSLRICPGTVRNWCSGKTRSPSPGYLKRAAVILKIDLRDLYYGIRTASSRNESAGRNE